MDVIRKCVFLSLLVELSLCWAQNDAKFEPEDGKVLVFIGQDTETIGGLENYANGYCDYFKMPGGITLYSNLSPGENSYGYVNKGNDGIRTIANWGAGNSCAECHLKNEAFDQAILALGVSIVNHEKRIARGEHDQLITELAEWIKESNRPVFLRLGYEFDGWDWNNYQKKHYLNAWKHVHQIFESLNVENVAFVWQSKGVGSDQKVLEEWYPGDDLVDWCGYSYFGDPDEEMLVFARKHGKPVFIAEATPVRQNDNLYFPTMLSDPKLEEKIWNEWFVPFFNVIRDNSDVIKAFSYINADWPAEPMWKQNVIFKHVDARIQVSDYVSKRWRNELSDSRYLMSTNDLFERIGFSRVED